MRVKWELEAFAPRSYAKWSRDGDGKRRRPLIWDRRQRLVLESPRAVKRLLRRPDAVLGPGDRLKMAETLVADAPTRSAGATEKSKLRHVLEFEKPLAKLEQQIHELESLQQQKQVDLTAELRQ